MKLCDFIIHPLLDEEKQEQFPITIKHSPTAEELVNEQFNHQNPRRRIKPYHRNIWPRRRTNPTVSDKDITITKIFDTKDEVYDDIRGNQYILTKEDVMKL